MSSTLAAELPRERDRSWGARTASFVLHTGLITLAVWATRPSAVRDVISLVPDSLVIWRTPRPEPPPDRPTATAPPSDRLVIPDPEAPAVAPEDVPTVPNWDPAPFAPTAEAAGPVVPAEPAGPPPPASTAPLDAGVVEEPPVLLEHPAPRYPEVLRQAGVEGRVLLEAVIDTTGRAERASVRVVSATHALFVPDATALVLGSRYAPGRFAGRAVRVRIVIPVVYTVRR